MKKDEGGFFIEATLTSARQSAGEEDLRTISDHYLHLCPPHVVLEATSPFQTATTNANHAEKSSTRSLIVPYPPPSKLDAYSDSMIDRIILRAVARPYGT